jgi:hypothetical protein
LVDRVLFLSVVFDLVLTIGVFMCFFSSVVCMVLLYYTLKDTRILVCCDYSVVSIFLSFIRCCLQYLGDGSVNLCGLSNQLNVLVSDFFSRDLTEYLLTILLI